MLNRGNQNSRHVSWAPQFARLFSLFLVLTGISLAETHEPKHVLLLMQEDISWPAFRLIDENARTVLRAGLPPGSLIFSEHLDRVHFSDPQFQAQQAADIQRKYANSKLDVIIGVGDVPTDLFPGVPFLYVRTDPSEARPSPSAFSKDLVNLWIELDAKKTLEAARRLQPDARQVFVIGSTSMTGRNLVAQVREQIGSESEGLPITYLSELTFEQICLKLSMLRTDSIVLFVSLSRDGAGRPFISADLIPRLSSVSGAPVYGLLDTQIGPGAVGGFVVRFGEMGKRAGELTLEMIAGHHPEDEAIRGEYVFDWRQLQRWKIAESALPAGSILLYRQPSIWEIYRYYIVGAGVLFLVEAILILGLLWQRADRKKSEQFLLERVSFEKMLSELSATFVNLPEEHVGATLEKSLGGLAEFLKLDRITLYGLSQDRDVWITFSWRREGVQVPPVTIETKHLPWWSASLLRNQSIFLDDGDDLPAEATVEKEYLTRLGAVSVATIPLRAGEELYGGISFVSTRHRVEWTGPLAEQLKLIAGIFSNALARERALEARFRHAAIVESSDDAIVSKNLDGLIMSWNAAAERLYGYSQSEAIGQSIEMLIPAEQLDEEEYLLESLKKGQRVEHHETVRIAKGGRRVPVSLTISPLKDSKGNLVGFSKIARDITDRKRAERLLRESEERFRLVADRAPVLIWMSGIDKLCNFFNQGWLNFTGRSIEEELGNGWVSSVHSEDVRRCIEIYSESFDARIDFQMEYRLRRFDGEYRWIVDYGVPRFESDGRFCGYIGSCVDITDRKSSAESLQALTGRLIHAQEEERARIARELHDDFNQRLALQCIDIEQLRKKLPKDEVEDRAKLDKMLQRAKSMSADIRALSHGLHSSRLQYIGLGPAVRGLCKEISEKYGISVDFAEDRIAVDISKEIELCLFRIAQEALGNIVKHSEAKHAWVALSADRNALRLHVRDHGRGFDLGATNRAAGIGLVGMSERLRLVGGKLSIKSQVSRGTELVAEVPLPVAIHDLVKTVSAGGMES